MLSRLSTPYLLRTLHSPPAFPMAARVISRALIVSQSTATNNLYPHSSVHFALSASSPTSSLRVFDNRMLSYSSSSLLSRGRRWSTAREFGKVIYASAKKDYRRARKRPAAKRSAEKELELDVRICIEETLPDDPEILNIAEMLRLNAPLAMKLAFDGLKDSKYKTRETSINDISCFESVELSVLLCNDEFISKLNKDWRDEDHPTDVLSMSQHIPQLNLPILMFGDIVISIETAAKQAKEREHTLIDEIRILLVHGLLHLLGFDHELSDEAEEEMEKEEELLLKSLGWKGKGLIQSAYDSETNETPLIDDSNDRKKEGSLRLYKPKFEYIFCDMDGTLLNSKSQISLTTAKALREATSRGVKIVIATGKTRPAVLDIMKMADLTGEDGVVSESSPGVFIQGLLVYGSQGREIYRRNLDPDICKEAFLYSVKHKVPLIAFSENRCLTAFDHPLVHTLHTIYHEPKAEIITSIEELLGSGDIQKVLFLDSAEGVANIIRPYWAEATGDVASVVQAQSDMLEIIPYGTSKGSGVRLLLDHLGVTPNEIMAIGDGENDVEMLELASLGVALSNGSDKAKAVANVIGNSNDEDGAADAIYRYAF